MKDDVDDITLELEALATTPSPFCEMTLVDTRTGMSVEVDQSMDCNMTGSPEHSKMIIQSFAELYFYFKDRKYEGEFDNKTKIKINEIYIDFGNVSGEKAFIWLRRFLKEILMLLDKEGKINIKEIDESIKNGTMQWV